MREICSVMRDWEWAKSEVTPSEMFICLDFVSYLDSVDLMELGSNATIRDVGLFGLIQFCLALFMSQFSHRSTLVSLRLLLDGEPCLAM